MNVQLIAVVKQ